VDNLLSDELWDAIALYLPERPTTPQRGRPPRSDRDCLRGILFVLREGIRWQSLPKELGCGSGSTCWRRFQQWTALGLWQKAHWHLVAALGQRGLLNLERAVVDSSSCRAQEGGAHTGPNPTDRAKAGCKRHLVTDGYGIPLVVSVGPANHRDETAVPELLWLLWAVLACIGGGRRRVAAFQGDRGYGFPWTIALVLAWGLRSLLGVRGSEHGSGLGHTRFVIERTHSWFGTFRRLVQCYEREEEHFLGFQQLAACIICARRLRLGKQPGEEFQPFAQAA
jgi:transposase